MAGVIRIPEERIGILNPSQFARLINDLLRAEGVRLGIPHAAIDTTSAVTVADGGLDAKIRPINNRRNTDRGWIPEGGSGWQFKSGTCPSANALAEDEFSKPKVVECIKNGWAYCFVSGDDNTAKKDGEILEKIHEQYRALGRTPNGRVLSASKVAAWVEDYPAIALQHFKVPIANWISFAQWAGQELMGNKYFPDQERSDICQELRSRIDNGERIIRILGRAGVGKTRVVFEALNSLGYRERVLYMTDSSAFDSAFAWYLQQENPDGDGILVLDEYTMEVHARISAHLRDLPKGFHVVTIGPVESDSIGDAFVLGHLLEENIADILKSYVRSIEDPQLNSIVKFCSGFPRLAVLVGRAIDEGQGKVQNWSDVERLYDVAGYLNKNFLPFDLDGVDGMTFRGISLFTRIGWQEGVEEESHALADFLGVGLKAMQNSIRALIEKGVLSKRGRFVYPTPEILANYVCRGFLKRYSSDELIRLFRNLPEAAQASFADRLRSMGDSPETRGIAKEVIGEIGFFHRLADLNDRSAARLLRRIAFVYPDAVMDILDGTIGIASCEDLLRLGQGRREVVWMLEGLVWLPRFFARSAKLLLRLSHAENESYGNNATATWVQLFQPALGGTSAPFSERLPILEESLASEDCGIRRLGVLALGAVINIGHIQRIGGPPDEIALSVQEWRPATFRDWSEIVVDGLNKTKSMLSDPDSSVRQEAVRVLQRHGRDLLRAGFSTEWMESVEILISDSFEVRSGLVQVIDDYLKFDSEGQPEARETIKLFRDRLAGSSFSDRLRKSLVRWRPSVDDENDEESDLEVIARESIENSESFYDEIVWLVSGEANSAFLFGQNLGVIDDELKLLDRIISSSQEMGADDRLICGYLYGVSGRLGEDWVDNTLDEWLKIGGRAMLVAAITYRIGKTDRAIERLIEMASGHLVSPVTLGRVLAGNLSEKMTVEQFSGLINALAEDADAHLKSVLLEAVGLFLARRPLESHRIVNVLRELVEFGPWTGMSSMDSHYWKEMAKTVIEDDPVYVAQICVRLAHEGVEVSAQDALNSILVRAIEVGGWEVFEKVVGPALVNDPIMQWKLDSILQGRTLLRGLDPEILADWIAQDVDNRLLPITYLTPVDDGHLHPLARVILHRWGDRDDVGSALASTFLSGTFWGPHSKWLEGKLGIVDEWKQDVDAMVRAWALRVSRGLLRQIESEKRNEEEEDL